jgi:hypothetical protein
MIDEDPKRHMFDVNNKKHLLNFPNSLGLTPLYVAAMNGHLNVIILNFINIFRL